jgi:hypothetical protein
MMINYDNKRCGGEQDRSVIKTVTNKDSDSGID